MKMDGWAVLTNLSKSWPTMPASTRAVKFFSSIHRMRFCQRPNNMTEKVMKHCVQYMCFMSYSISKILMNAGCFIHPRWKCSLQDFSRKCYARPWLTAGINNAFSSGPCKQSHDSLLRIVENCLPGLMVTCLRINVCRGPLGRRQFTQG